MTSERMKDGIGKDNKGRGKAAGMWKTSIFEEK